MKRILLVGPYPPPYGGMASQIVELAPHLAESGYGVTVLTFTKGKDEAFSPSPGVEVCRVDARRALLDLRNLPLLCRVQHRLVPRDVEWITREIVGTSVVRRIVEEQNVSLINTYMITSSMFVPHLRREFRDRVKFVTTIFGELVERQDIIERNKGFYRQILLESDHVLATSQYCAGLARVVDFDPSLVEVIYIGVDVDRFSPELDGTSSGDSTAGVEPACPRQGVEANLPADKIRLLFVGRFHEEMGLDVILDVIPDVVAQRPDACFVLVGASGPLSGRAVEIQARYPEHVCIRQNVPFSALPHYYAASRVLLAPTRDMHACMGVSIKEAMAAGKAIIASRSGGIPEAVIPGQSGIILDFDQHGRLDRTQFVQAMLSLLERPQTIEEWGRRARQRAVEIFDNRISLQRHVAMVERLIGKPV